MEYPKTTQIFHHIKNSVVRDQGFPLARTNLYPDCQILMADQYAHTFCRDGYNICISERIELLTPGQIAGILWHEFGKLISGAQDDHKADNYIRKYFRIRLKFDNSLKLWYI